MTPKKIAYKPVEGDTLHLYVFDARADATAGPAVPAIVFFCGGGWTARKPEQLFPHCEYFASRGLFAASVEYRVADLHGTSPFECVADGKSAMRFVRAHAAELGVDPARILAGVGSAGGHVAACTAVIEGFDEPGEDTSVSARPEALVLFNPALDTTRSDSIRKFFKGREREVSPLHHADAQTPPTIIHHGTNDQIVPVETARAFRDRAVETGVRCELVLYEGQGHGFYHYGHDIEIYKETVRASDRFLAELGFLDGEPTI